MNRSRKAPSDVLLMNRISMLLLLLAASIALLSGALWLLRQPVFDIARIVIEPGGYMPDESARLLRSQLAGVGNRNFFALDLKHVQHMLEQLPWVHRAQVRREFPRRLHITLHEHVPEAFWHEHGADRGSTLVSSSGRVFDPGPREQVGLDGQHMPALHGPPGSAQDMLILYRTLAPVLESLGRKISGLTLSTRDTWSARLDNGTRIELGRGPHADILQRVRRFAATVSRVQAQYPCDLAAGSIHVADLRHGADRYALLCSAEEPIPSP